MSTGRQQHSYFQLLRDLSGKDGSFRRLYFLKMLIRVIISQSGGFGPLLRETWSYYSVQSTGKQNFDRIYTGINIRKALNDIINHYR